MTARSAAPACIALLAIVFGLGVVHSKNGHASSALQGLPTDDPTSILTFAEADDPCGIRSRQGSLKSFACGVVSYLVKDTAAPDWETSWSTKCDLHLEECPEPANTVIADTFSKPGAKTGTSISTPQDTYSKDLKNLTIFELRLLKSAKVPVQFRGSDQVMGIPANDSADLTLASVLFNNAAKDALPTSQGTLASNLSRGIIPEFQPGSVIAKAVWGIFPLDNQGNIAEGTPAFASILQSNDSTKSTYEASWNKNYSASLPNVLSYWKQYQQVKSAWTVPSGGANWKFDSANCAPKPGQLPWNCMNFISVSPSLKQAAQLTQNTQNGLTINSGCGNAPKCNIALMGIHFMIRLRKTDPLPGNRASSWVFITLWWTGVDNGTNLPSPWKYYQINVTQDFRNDPPNVGAASNVCFNPYLEGKRGLGAASNCVNCHYYAAYNASTSTSMSSTGTDPQHGLSYQPAERYPSNGCVTGKDYAGQQQVVCTDFVWSSADVSIQGTLPGTHPSNGVR
jgi:hypothetical protein